MHDTFHKDLRNLRRELGLTQTELAYRAGVSTALISLAENDRCNLTIKLARRLAAALNAQLVLKLRK